MSEGVLRRAVRDALTENLGLKAISLVASVFLFAAVRGGADIEKTLDVDVVTQGPPARAERVLVADVPDRVRIVVQGPRSLLASLRAEDVPPVEADLRSTQARSFAFEDSLFDLPAGVRIRSMDPSAFPLAWETRRERRLPIVASLRGDPLPGQSLRGQPLVVPSEVTLVGAESALDEIDSAHTETVDVQGLGAGRYSKRAKLRRPPRHTWWDREPAVAIRFEIGPDLVERVFRQLPVRVAESAWPMSVHPRAVDVVLRGPRETVAALDSDALLPFLDGRALEERGPGSHRETPQLEDLPSGVELVGWRPGHVFVDVRRPR